MWNLKHGASGLSQNRNRLQMVAIRLLVAEEMWTDIKYYIGWINTQVLLYSWELGLSCDTEKNVKRKNIYI